MTRNPACIMLAVSILLMAGCEKNQLAGGLPENIACDTCHGEDGNPAPPAALDGSEETTALGVGAHQAHLKDGRVRKAVDCEECHRVPTQVDQAGHVDPAPPDMVWGALATAQGQSPVWDRDAATCSGTYCHGATLAGGIHTGPIWTQVDGSQSQCDGCHGNPPPEPAHPDLPDCHTCHPLTVTAAGTIDIQGGHHMDGIRDVPASTCESCHGGGGSPAPPVDTQGNSATTERGVGAHREHLADSTWRAPVVCAECHIEPQLVGDPGHNDTALPAELTWGPLATADGAQPAFDGASTSCSGVYCHGATLRPGGQHTAPDWTLVDGSQSQCDSCHGNPPAGGHPQRSDCETCHDQVINAAGGIIAPDLHINGSVEAVTFACDACHGSGGNPAPPVDTLGNSATTERGVGAHREHLAASSWHATVACDECHQVPSELASPGHADTALPAELTWGPLAAARGAQPSFDPAGETCNGTYCHGATLRGTGTNRNPQWTNVGAGEAVCGSCHSLPPETNHPQQSNCEQCHPCVVDSNQAIIPSNAYLHINGTRNLEPLGSCPPP